MIDICTLPLSPCPSFSCELEKILWLIRHAEQPHVRCWWIGFEFAQKGRCFDRVMFELENNPELFK